MGLLTLTHTGAARREEIKYAWLPAMKVSEESLNKKHFLLHFPPWQLFLQRNVLRLLPQLSRVWSRLGSSPDEGLFLKMLLINTKATTFQDFHFSVQVTGL